MYRLVVAFTLLVAATVGASAQGPGSSFVLEEPARLGNEALRDRLSRESSGAFTLITPRVLVARVRLMIWQDTHGGIT